MTSARSASAAVETASPPVCWASRAALPEPLSLNSAFSPNPRASERAMLPLPMKPSCTAATGRSGLVEEAALHQPCALFSRKVHVARSQQKGLVRNALHPAIERVREPAGKVDQTLCHVGVGF